MLDILLKIVRNEDLAWFIRHSVPMGIFEKDSVIEKRMVKKC